MSNWRTNLRTSFRACQAVLTFASQKIALQFNNTICLYSEIDSIYLLNSWTYNYWYICYRGILATLSYIYIYMQTHYTHSAGLFIVYIYFLFKIKIFVFTCAFISLVLNKTGISWAAQQHIRVYIFLTATKFKIVSRDQCYFKKKKWNVFLLQDLMPTLPLEPTGHHRFPS